MSTELRKIIGISVSMKVDMQTIKSSASADFFDQMTKIKRSYKCFRSLTFNAINTKVLVVSANTRFVQLVDGVDNAAPL